jgi:hypothetical protein
LFKSVPEVAWQLEYQTMYRVIWFIGAILSMLGRPDRAKHCIDGRYRAFGGKKNSGEQIDRANAGCERVSWLWRHWLLKQPVRWGIRSMEWDSEGR